MSNNILGMRTERSPSVRQVQPFAPQSQSKLRNSMTFQDFLQDDKEESSLRSRLAQERVIQAVPNANADSDEEDASSSSLRKRFGLTNMTISSKPKPITELPSVIKSISMKAHARPAVQNQNQNHYSPVPFFQQSNYFPSAVYNEDSTIYGSDNVEQVSFPPPDNLELEESCGPAFQQAYKDKDTIDPVEELYINKPSSSSVDKTTTNTLVEEPTTYFGDFNNDDNYGYEAVNNRDTSSPGLDDDFTPVSDEEDDVEPAFEEEEEEEEEEPIKPIKVCKINFY